MVRMQDFYLMVCADQRFDTRREIIEDWDKNETQLTIGQCSLFAFMWTNGIKSCIYLCSSTIKMARYKNYAAFLLLAKGVRFFLK